MIQPESSTFFFFLLLFPQNESAAAAFSPFTLYNRRAVDGLQFLNDRRRSFVPMRIIVGVMNVLRYNGLIGPLSLFVLPNLFYVVKFCFECESTGAIGN